MQLSDIKTPRLLLNKDKLEANVQRMNTHINKLGGVLRPHVKTTKSYKVASYLVDSLASPMTVSTLKEAEYFADHGAKDILYAVAIASNKLNQAASLLQRGVKLTVITDSVESASLISAFASAHKITFPVLVEIDVDGHRSGVAPDSPELINIAKQLHQASYVDLQGLLAHAGSSYDCESVEDIRQLAAQERALAVSSAQSLKSAGLPCPVVSIGSTPTTLFSSDFSGVTEMRAGVYAFFDLVMAGLGVCDVDDIAISVLATVIGHQESKGWVIVDAGWMAMSRDRGTANQKVDQGYGRVQDEKGNLLQDVWMTKTNQEHGILTSRKGGLLDVKQFPIGSRVRILPNHACATSAQHQSYLVIDSDCKVLDEWERFSGW